MGRRNIDSFWDRLNLLNMNNNFIELYKDFNFTFELKKLSEETIEYAKKVNSENKEVQHQLNNLVIESGNANAEVSQARGSDATLNSRLANPNYTPIKDEVNRQVISKSATKRPMLTFVDDDGRLEVLQKWEPILQEKANKLTVALVSSWIENEDANTMSWEDVHRLKNQYGVEFVNHTYEHKHAQQITDDEVDAEFKQNKTILQREGLTHDIIVQPYGENTDSVRRISRNYAKANVSVKEGINTLPLDTFRLFRITLGEDLYTTFEQYKSKLDEAIATNGWIIFKSHSQYTSFNENQQQLIRQIIDYCRANNFIEATMEEGLSDRGNLIDVGDYTTRVQGSDYYILDKEGKIYSNKFGVSYREIGNKGSDVNSPISSFDSGTTLEQVYGSKTAGFPDNKAGTLKTYKANPEYYSFQFFYPYENNNVYKRILDRTTLKWGEFVKQNADFTVTSTKNSLNNTPASEFSLGTTKEIVQTINATGFPENVAGTLETNRLHPISYSYQLYYVYNNNHVYKRFYNSTNNWTSWERIDNTKFNISLRESVNVVVPSNSIKHVNIPLNGITNYDNVVITPSSGIEEGLMFNGYISSDNNVRLTLFNTTAKDITTNRPYKIDVIKNS
ncbi:polysaccharide deacetylase family protein [Staphylococcus saprophyticus]|nr:polysaccharide deacetylase family protein [Staphylococcus saprophyticus]